MSPAGYSNTPLPKKLGIKPGAQVLLRHAPPHFDNTLGELPEAVAVRSDLRSRGPFNVIVCFCKNVSVLQRELKGLLERLDSAGGLWIAWPKKSSGIETDLGDAVVRKTGLATGLVDNKVCAVDETWSGLRFVVRLKDRSGNGGH